MADYKNVYIIIPVHNRKATTLTCLHHLESQGILEQFQVVVVDDGSTDGTADAIRSAYPSVTILQGNGQLWWTGAIKKGMEYAYSQGSEYLIWLNDDCIIPTGTLQNLISFLETHPHAIIGAQGYSDHAHTHLAFGGKFLKNGYYELFECPSGEILPCKMLSGNLVCIPRSVVDRIGFPKTKLPHYGGDTLYLIHARKAGFNLFVDARTSLVDMPGTSKLNPNSWVLQEGKPWAVIKLIFQTESILSWWVWWTLLIEDHGFWGVLIFIRKYMYLFPKILLITGLRLLPVESRRKFMVRK